MSSFHRLYAGCLFETALSRAVFPNALYKGGTRTGGPFVLAVAVGRWTRGC